MRHTRHASSAVSTEAQTQLANLQFENQRLRNTRRQATQRLDDLIARLTAQQEETPEAAAEPTFAQEHAA